MSSTVWVRRAAYATMTGSIAYLALTGSVVEALAVAVAFAIVTVVRR